MDRPTVNRHVDPPYAAPPGVTAAGPAVPGPAALLTPADLLLRRLRYYGDLLIAGYRQALKPDPMVRSLRAERIALGIDLPELDAVPLWSARGDAGTISIPFIEFILKQIHEDLDALCREPALRARNIGEHLAGTRRAIAGALDRALGAGPPSARPRLRDVAVPRSVVEDLCGPGGRLEAGVQVCDLLIHGETAAGH